MQGSLQLYWGHKAMQISLLLISAIILGTLRLAGFSTVMLGSLINVFCAAILGTLMSAVCNSLYKFRKVCVRLCVCTAVG